MQESGFALHMHGLLPSPPTAVSWGLQLVPKGRGGKCRDLEARLRLTLEVSKWKCGGSGNSLAGSHTLTEWQRRELGPGEPGSEVVAGPVDHTLPNEIFCLSSALISHASFKADRRRQPPQEASPVPQLEVTVACFCLP